MKTRYFTILSARGGVGKSTLAVGIARAAADAGHRVILVDADTVAPTLDATLGCEDRVVYDLGDLLLGRREAQGVLIPVSSTLAFVSGAYRMGEVPTEVHLRACLASLAQAFDADAVVMDTASPADPMTQLCAALSEDVLVVTTPHPHVLRATATLVDKMQGGRMHGMHLVLNQMDMVPPTDVREVVDTAQLSLIGVVPRCAERDACLADAMQRDPTLCRAWSNIAARLMGQRVPLLTGVTAHRRALLGI